MTVPNSRCHLSALVLAGTLYWGMAFSPASLFAEQHGPSRSKPSAASAESKKTSAEEAKKSSAQGGRRTPFGWKKAAEKAEETPPPPASSAFVEVEEQGDTIVFKRRTPFGRQSWRKKRSELTSQEQEMLKVHRAKQSEDKTAAETEPAVSGGPTATR